MGRKGTNDTNKLASTFIVCTDTMKKIEEKTADNMVCRSKLLDMDISSLDPQTQERLLELCDVIKSVSEVVSQKIALTRDQLDKLIARLMETDKAAQAKLAGINENAAAAKKNLMGGKR